MRKSWSPAPIVWEQRYRRQNSGATYHNVLNVLFYQVYFVGNNYRAAKCVQIGVVQLIWGTADFIGTVNLDVPRVIWE